MSLLKDFLQRSTLRRFLPAAMAVTLFGCVGSDGVGPPDAGQDAGVASVTVEPRAAMLWETGARQSYSALVVDQDGRELTNVAVAWTSSEPSVAEVDASGLVTAKASGWTIIHASAGGVTGSADAVIVTPDSPKDRRDCIACHAPEYAAQHGSETPTTCLSCHEGRSFTGAQDHVTSSGGFELLGAHASLSCASCHEADGTPRYPGVDDGDCIACHQSNYDGQHAGSGFPTTCLDCHTTDSFAGASFDHDALFFPISSGKHQGRWNGCETCHTDPNDYSTFTCFSCHQHSQDEMDDKHSDVSGYSYDSAACYSCHPDGREP